MKVKSAKIVKTKTGEYVNYHLRLKQKQYEKLWDLSNEKNTEISKLISQSIDSLLGEIETAKRQR